MKAINQSHKILGKLDGQAILKKIERCGRTCYQSFDHTAPDSAEKFVCMIIKNGHESVLEHVSVTVDFITDRGILAELTRHRLASYSVESTRYCNYSKDKFNRELKFIKPVSLPAECESIWIGASEFAERSYFSMLRSGATPQEARSVLPMSLKTEIIMTANLREWREIFNQRCDKAAHPQMRSLMIDTLKDFHNQIPVVFDDIYEKYVEDKQ